jgi:hypothetical protein
VQEFALVSLNAVVVVIALVEFVNAIKAGMVWTVLEVNLNPNTLSHTNSK